MNCGPLSVSRYVRLPYEMTQLSSNTVATLVNDTVLTNFVLTSFLYRYVKTAFTDCLISSLIMDPECPLAGTLTVQRLEPDVVAPD